MRPPLTGPEARVLAAAGLAAAERRFMPWLGVVRLERMLELAPASPSGRLGLPGELGIRDLLGLLAMLRGRGACAGLAVGGWGKNEESASMMRGVYARCLP